MRYRVKDYTVDVYQGNVRVFLTVPSTLIEAFPSFTSEEERKVTEAIRLIIDETAGVVFCSSMQKDNIIQMQAQNNQDGTTEIAIYFAIPEGKTIASTDQFTIEMDWGDTVEDVIPTDYAKQSNVGTSSDQASESGSSLFAVLKAVWNKVVNIYNALTDGTNGLSAIKSAIPSVSGLATESNATSNKNAILQAIADNAGVPTLTVPSTTASQELAPNTLYVFSSRSTALTLTLGTPITGIANDYHFFIVCGSTAPTVNFPSGISWNGGEAPTIAADKTYEVSILNNVAAYFEV